MRLGGEDAEIDAIFRRRSPQWVWLSFFNSAIHCVIPNSECRKDGPIVIAIAIASHPVFENGQL
jgi:hypothetical protein